MSFVSFTTRVSDSDDLKMSENEVGRLAVGIEKEMFNLCLSTDSKYKNKYRSLMFNLKDPKNKVSQQTHVLLSGVRMVNNHCLFVSGLVLQSGGW